MLTKKITISILLIFLSILLSSCASTTAPGGWLSTPRETQREAYGAWISVEYDTGGKIDGEFIAEEEDTLFILTQTEAKDILTSVPINLIKKGILTTYDSKHWILGVWTLGGSLSTASHGVALIISFPAWILTGTIATVGQSYAPIERYPVKSWEELKKYSRFPQGLPKGLDRKELRIKWKY